MVDPLKARAEVIFDRAADAIRKDCDGMHAEHSMKGLLASGATAKRAVDVFERRLSEALQQINGEAANTIEHRGARWNASMSCIATVLEARIAGANEMLAPSFRLARIETRGSAREAVDGLIAQAGQKLRQELAAFRDGWTAPKPKKWNERHPIAYAIALLLIGSLVGAAINQTAALLTKKARDYPVLTQGSTNGASELKSRP